MSNMSKFGKWIVTGIGAFGGAVYFYRNYYGEEESLLVSNSWTTTFEPSVKWDYNWDKRDPKSVVKPVNPINEVEENKYNEALSANRPKATRHFLLIRHGQYNTDGKTDADRTLTPLGRIQAESTGKRLAELGLPYTMIVKSTMTRALQTSKIIEQFLPDLPVKEDSLLAEGAPIPPEPPLGNWKSEKHFHQDGPRIEAAFRKYFHRADPADEKNSYFVIIGHGNVIRYFVCRALQFPPEAWLRITLSHASITWLSVYPNGRVQLKCANDTGHMIPLNITAS